MRVVLGGLMDGNTKVEIAAKMGISHFCVGRIIHELQQQLAIAA
jgi:hypothetical protein